MLHETLADDRRGDEIAPGFVRPAWGAYCFSNVPDTIRSLFGDDSAARRRLPETVFEGVSTGVDHVVCAFVDGFGWNHFQRVRDDHWLLTRLAERTLLLLIADHGEVDSTPETTLDLGGLDLDEHLQCDATGEPIPALGGPRNLQFHAREDHRDALRQKLESGLAPLDPLVLDRETIIEDGLFGDHEPSQRFERRCPDLLVIPHEGFAWYDDGHLSNVAMHGGLHPDEMLVPFAAARIDALQG